MKKQKFYVFLVGKKKGITDSWDECKKVVTGHIGAKYKSFESKEEAKRWLEAGADYSVRHLAAIKGIYFDAGTGSNGVTRANVTDENGKGLLHEIISDPYRLDDKGHFPLLGKTNNFGELTACKFALEIALKDDVKHVFGDSKLIINYWSKGFVKGNMSQETKDLALGVKMLREQFEASGGSVEYISGGGNPADLGFHKG